MDQSQHNALVNFIWGIADDVLRDVLVRGKYRDAILPMVVIRRLDALLEPRHDAVLKMKAQLDKAKVTNQDPALRKTSGHAFYNTSQFTLRRLLDNPKQLRANFTDYLDGFSPNVGEIIEKFDFRNQLKKLDESDVLGHLISKFLDPEINLSPEPVLDGAGKVRIPGLTNHGMSAVYEELLRRFSEENNEEAGEHFTPRDAVHLMASLILLPIKKQVTSGTYLLYDCACGTGGMLTESDVMLRQIAEELGKDVSIHLYGQEVNPETYAICKADLLIKGEEEGNIAFGSTISNDGFQRLQFDFMLANPPYGKSWKTDLERLCGGEKGEMRDPRFVVSHGGDNEFSLVTRSSDGQMMFLANMLSKMKHDSPLGSRIAEVHNGSSLFTGDAGQGESNIRRWIIENDWLEAIVALPLNLFYNTGIATYIWVLSNRKAKNRRGKVQLIDATQWFRPLRKNLGKKNCELGPEDIQRICDTFLAFKETAQSKIFPNAAFGYWKVKVERPLRLHSQLTAQRIETLRYASGDEEIRAALHDKLGDALFTSFGSVRKKLEKLLEDWGKTDEDEGEGETGGRSIALPDKKKKKLLDPATWKRDAMLVETALALRKELGDSLFTDHNVFLEKVDAALKKLDLKLAAADLKQIIDAVSWRDETAAPVIAKRQKLKPGQTVSEQDTLYGWYPGSGSQHSTLNAQIRVAYEPDSELRDFEQIPLLEEGGIEAFIRREVLPYTPDAWIVEADTKIGYEISFTRHFYQPPKLRSLAEISADILKLEQETEGLLTEITKGVKA